MNHMVLTQRLKSSESSTWDGFTTLQRFTAGAGISLSTSKRWLKEGLPYYQACKRGRILIRPSDVEAFLQRKSR